jgi:hypothetical protein
MLSTVAAAANTWGSFPSLVQFYTRPMSEARTDDHGMHLAGGVS